MWRNAHDQANSSSVQALASRSETHKGSRLSTHNAHLAGKYRSCRRLKTAQMERRRKGVPPSPAAAVQKEHVVGRVGLVRRVRKERIVLYLQFCQSLRY